MSHLRSGPTLMKGVPLYDALAKAFAAYAVDPTKLPATPPVHPQANCLPMLPDKERPAFRESLSRNQNHPVILHVGMLADGRNRARELIELGKPINTEIFAGTGIELLRHLKAENIDRRHLSESQRADYAALIARLRVGSNQHTVGAQICAPSLPIDEMPSEEMEPLISQTEAAEMFNVSRRSVQHAAKVIEEGSPELHAAVQAGRIAVSTAADLANLPKEEQQQVAAMSEKEILAKVKDIRDKKNKERRTERADRITQLSNASAKLPTGRKFPLIYWDPATKYAAGDSNRSTENKYPTMPEEEIAALPIADLALEHSVMLVWTTVPWLRKTIRLIEGFGFEYKSATFWDKIDIGTGFWWQNQIEILIAATKGNPPAPENGSILGPGLYREKKTDHSVKPIYFRDRIDAVEEWKDWPKVELFARVNGPMPNNWFAWGNQANVPEQQSLLPDEAGEPVKEAAE